MLLFDSCMAVGAFYTLSKPFLLPVVSCCHRPRRFASLCPPTAQASDSMKIVFVATEVAPWSKVGGLADVMAALPAALAARGHEVMTVTPRYSQYDGVESTGVLVPLELPPEFSDPHDDTCGQNGMESRIDVGDKGSGGGSETDFNMTDETFRNTHVSENDQRSSHTPSLQGEIACTDFQTLRNTTEHPAQSEAEHGDSISHTSSERFSSTAELYCTEDQGVQRVFVDHPLLHASDIYAPPPPQSPETKDERSESESQGYVASETCDVPHSLPPSATRTAETPPRMASHSFTYIDNRSISGRSLTYVEAGTSLGDLDIRYSILCQAALAAAVFLGHGSAAGVKGQKTTPSSNNNVVFVANDWPSALQILRLKYVLQGVLREQGGGVAAGEGEMEVSDVRSHTSIGRSLRTTEMDECAGREFQKLLARHLATAATAFCIHNLAYQGVFPADAFPRLCLPPTAIPALCTATDWRRMMRPLNLSGSDCRRRKASKFTTSGAMHGCDNATLTRPHSKDEPSPSAPSSIAMAHRSGEERTLMDTIDGSVALRAAIGHPDPVVGDHVSSGIRPFDVDRTQAMTDAFEGMSSSWQPSADAMALIDRCRCSDGQLNFMRAALLAADEVITVSPSYAEEIRRDDTMGCGLKDILLERGVIGIMNGIDVTEWDPSTDPQLPVEGRFNLDNFDRGKSYMKASIQKRLGLHLDPDAALAVFIGRLTEQKGVDVLLSMMPLLFAGPPTGTNPTTRTATAGTTLTSDAKGVESVSPGLNGNSDADSMVDITADRHSATDASRFYGDAGQVKDLSANALPALQIVLLGSGERWMESSLNGLKELYPGRVAGITFFSEELAHWLLAAGDYVLIPSRFEPCGLVAQCAARYGTVPVVAAVGGLQDLVNPDIGLALSAPHPVGNGVGRAVDAKLWASTLRNLAQEAGGPVHRAMQRKCMSLELSWRKPAEEWETILQRLARRRRDCHEPRDAMS